MMTNRRENYIRDTSAPIAIHEAEEIALYHTLSEELKVEWNRLAQDSADKFNNECYGPDRNTKTLYRWSPCDFRTWVTSKKPQ